MALGNVSRFDERMQNARAGIRVNSRVPVAVEWAESGQPRRAEGYTVDTSTKGCLAVVVADLQKFVGTAVTDNRQKVGNTGGHGRRG